MTHDPDAYDNLILLCPSDHKLVDDQVLTFPPERLRVIKAAHESWVRTTLETGRADTSAPQDLSRVVLAPPKWGDWGLIGRDEELTTLHERLERHGGGAVVSVVGLGGLGKTTLALGYLDKYRGCYKLIGWIDAARPELIAGQYRALVRNLNGSVVPESDAVSSALAELASSHDWLLVFDNARSPGELHPYLPPGPGRVLVTSRNETWAAKEELVLRLERLSTKTVAKWIGKAVPKADPKTAVKLAERLDGLPLAVTQAIAYMARPRETAGGYLAKLTTKEGQQKVLTANKPPGYPAALATTWDVAIEALTEEAPQSVELLRFLAHLYPDEVPLEILDGLLEDEDTGDLLEALRRTGLVRCSDTHVSVHRLVQDVVRWPLTAAEEIRYVTSWATHLAVLCPSPEEHGTQEWFADLALHLLELTDLATKLRSTPQALAAIATSAGISLREQARYITSQTLLKRSLAIIETTEGSDSITAAAILVELGKVRYELQDLAKARQSLERAQAIFEGKYGPEHVQVGECQDNLGKVLRKQGHIEDAKQQHERALYIFENHYGPDHPRVAVTLGNLGVVFRRKGRYAAARERHQRALEIETRVHGPDDPRVGRSLDNLGNVLRRIGELGQAQQCHEQALAIFERAYGQMHPQVARSLDNLGIVFRLRDRLDEAQTCHNRALALEQHAFGPSHPEVAFTLDNLGQILLSVGDRQGAPEYYERALEHHARALVIFEQAYQPGHCEIAYTLDNLAQTNHRLGSLDQARAYHERALVIFEMTFGPDHPETKRCRRNPVGTMELRSCRLDEPVVAPVLEGLTREYEERYDASDEMSQGTVEEFDPPSGGFVVLVDCGLTVAGGGYRHLEPGVGEIKRMWTHPDRRRRGYARMVLDALEQLARDAGYSWLRLETGPEQPEARALYEQRYRQIPRYGRYSEDIAFEVGLVEDTNDD